MLVYTIKRLLQSVITVLLIVSIVFLLMRLMSTDYYFTEDELIKLTDEQKNDKLKAAGLLEPPLVQLGKFYKQLFTQGSLGTSRRIQANVPVTQVIAGKFAVSMKLGIVAIFVSLSLGLVLGILQAQFKEGILDGIGTAYTILVRAVPALVSYSLILVFGVKLLGLPSMYSTRNVAVSSILPVICLSIGAIANYAVWIRRYMVDELTKDYIRLAKVKGLTNSQIMFKHVMKNALVPMAQTLPTSFVLTIGGSLLVERFFSVPGMGALLVDSVGRYDVNLVQALVMLYATMGVIGMFIGDILMMLLDPRIRLVGKGETR